MSRKIRRTPTVIVGMPSSSRIKVKAAAAKFGARKESLKTWFGSIDWYDWWNDWFLSVNEKNQYLYKRITNFIDAKAESIEQRDFLHWYLGPESSPEQDDRYVKYANVASSPVGWTKKRAEGGWFHDVGLRAFGNDIIRRTNALDALREAGNKIGVYFMVRAGKMAQTVDEFFHGNPFVPGMSLAENMNRFQQYMAAQEAIQKYYAKAQDLYAKSHGVNFEDMAGLVKIMEAAALSATQKSAIEGHTQTPMQVAVSRFVEVAMAKAGKYPAVAQLLPGDVIDAVAESVEDAQVADKDKKKVQ